MPPPVAEPAQDVPAATADPAPPAPDSGPTPATPSTSTSTSILDDDWVDRLERHGLPAQGDPLATPAQLPAVNVDRPDRFELIWPSGEVDEDFGAVAAVAGDDGRDRVGTTARVVRAVQVVDEPDPTEEPTDLWDFEATGPIFGAAPAPSDAPAADPGDETVLSMRRAIDTIEAESRSRDVTVAQPDPVHSPDLPGRIAARGESSVWTIPTTGTTTGESVFDDVRTPPSFDPGPGERAPATSGDAEPAPEPDRVSALRRLIGGLRRR